MPRTTSRFGRTAERRRVPAVLGVDLHVCGADVVPGTVVDVGEESLGLLA
jgi:hypothetical protein